MDNSYLDLGVRYSKERKIHQGNVTSNLQNLIMYHCVTYHVAITPKRGVSTKLPPLASTCMAHHGNTSWHLADSKAHLWSKKGIFYTF